MKNEIINISAENIYQHPDNPRKDLGDLEELSDSIKKKGIMQNLTVMIGHYIGDLFGAVLRSTKRKSR